MFGERNIKLFYLKALLKIKSLLNTQKYRRVLIFLFFFLMSLGFWLLQTLKNDFETDIYIPVKLVNVPNDVVLTGKPIAKLRVVVKDKGTNLLNYYREYAFYPIQLNFKEYYSRGSHVVIRTSELEKKVQAQLNASTKLIAIRPEVVDYIYSVGTMKKVPVVLRGRVTSSMQYNLTDTLFAPDSVFVYAPQPMIQSIKVAYTQLVLFDGISETKHLRVPLLQIRGAKFVPSVVNLTLPVDVLTEKTLEVPLVGTNFPVNRSLRTFPSKVKVTFQVGLHRFKSIRSSDFVFEVPYEELLNSKIEKYQLKLKSTPVGVSHVRIVPSQVDFLIEKVMRNGN